MKEIYEVEEKKLRSCVESGADVVIYMGNGFQVHGRILDYDQNVILVESGGREQMVYRHAASTIALPR